MNVERWAPIPISVAEHWGSATAGVTMGRGLPPVVVADDEEEGR